MGAWSRTGDNALSQPMLTKLTFFLENNWERKWLMHHQEIIYKYIRWQGNYAHMPILCLFICINWCAISNTHRFIWNHNLCICHAQNTSGHDFITVLTAATFCRYAPDMILCMLKLHATYVDKSMLGHETPLGGPRSVYKSNIESHCPRSLSQVEVNDPHF